MKLLHGLGRLMIMIEVNTTLGWMDYCNDGVITDIIDMDGVVLKTGDFVEVLNHNQDYSLDIAMVVFDEFQNFISDNEFYIDGWKNVSHTNDYLFRKTNKDLIRKSHYRIKSCSCDSALC